MIFFPLSLTLTSTVHRKFAQGTNITTVVGMARHHVTWMMTREYCRKEFKFIPIFKDKCINNSIGYSCTLFLKLPK